MSIRNLLQSQDDGSKLRASLLRLREVQAYLNNDYGKPHQLLGLPSTNLVDVTIDTSPLYLIEGSTRVRVNVSPQTTTNDFTPYLVEKLFGFSEKNPYTLEEHEWYLSVEEWPFLTVELIADCLKHQAEQGSFHTPHIIAQHLPHFFPNVDYLKLLEWYKNGFFSLDGDASDPTSLRNIMLRDELRQEYTTQMPPSDMSL